MINTVFCLPTVYAVNRAGTLCIISKWSQLGVGKLMKRLWFQLTLTCLSQLRKFEKWEKPAVVSFVFWVVWEFIKKLRMDRQRLAASAMFSCI
jgi:hypothetical protein